MNYWRHPVGPRTGQLECHLPLRRPPRPVIHLLDQTVPVLDCSRSRLAISDAGASVATRPNPPRRSQLAWRVSGRATMPASPVGYSTSGGRASSAVDRIISGSYFVTQLAMLPTMFSGCCGRKWSTLSAVFRRCRAGDRILVRSGAGQRASARASPGRISGAKRFASYNPRCSPRKAKLRHGGSEVR